MSNNVVDWKRIPIPNDTFNIENFIYVEPKKEYFNTEKSDIEFIKDDWFWDFPKSLEEHFKNNKIEKIKLNNDAVIKRCVELKNNEMIVEKLYLEVPSNTKSKIYLDYHSQGEDSSRVFSQIYVYMEENSSLEITRLQRLSDDSMSFFEILTNSREYSNFKLNDFQIGSKYKVVTTESHLKEKASAIFNPLFLGDINSLSDLAYTVFHRGMRAESVIEGRGVLKSGARKVFRGNLYFDRGSKKSVGEEEERCILFDEDIRSDSIPALMCDEDDVLGAHAASVGKFDEDNLFYIMSRGFSEKDAKVLIANALFSEVVETIDNSEFYEKLQSEIDRRFGGI